VATFNADGIEGLELSFEQFAAIPDDVVENMLQAGGRVVAAAHRAEIRQLGLHKKGLLENAIAIHSHVSKENKRIVVIYPEGTHHTYKRRETVRVYKRSKSGRRYTVGGGTAVATNNDVGFVHEFGAPNHGIKASQWMKKANDKSADAMVTAELDVYDAWLKSIDL